MGQETPQNVVRYLRRAATDCPDRPALIVDGRRPQQVAFKQLWDAADAISSALLGRGLRPGDRAVCMIPMSIDLYACLMGVLKMGAVAVFVDPWIGAKQIAAFAGYASPKAFIGVPRSHVLRLLHPKLRRIPVTVTTGIRLGPIPAKYTLRELLAEPGDGVVHSAPLDVEQPALITFTTGSSGTPKGANRTHRFLAAQHQALKAEFPYRDDDVDMPMFPVFALNNLAQGVTSVVPTMDFKDVANVNGATICRQMEEHGVTTCTASPPFFDRLAGYLKASEGSPPPLRRILTGGAPVTDRQLKNWLAALPGTEITVVYGSTEAEPVAHINASDRIAAHADAKKFAPGICVGRPTQRVAARVIRIHPRPIELLGDRPWDRWQLPTGEPGELVVRGDHVCKDYYLNPTATKDNKITDHSTVWHRMGDTGYFDDHGRFWLVGRVHSTITRSGRHVHPLLLETIAKSHGVEQAAALALPDEDLGQRVALVVRTTKPNHYDPTPVRRDATRAGIPMDDLFVTGHPLPVDPRHNAKIDYLRLRDWLQSGGSGQCFKR